MRAVLEWCLQQRLLVLSLGFVFCAVGVLALRSVPIDAVPDITNVQVMINTKTGALSPEQIERQVTYPIELELNGVPGVVESRSLSKYGLSQVIVVFDNTVDIYWAREQLFQRITNVQLPDGLKPELAPISTGLGEVLMYTVEATEKSDLMKLPELQRLITLREIQERQIRPQLRKVEGVADVDTNGGYRKQIHINIFPEKLKSYGLSVLELKELLANMGRSSGGGFIESNGQQIIIGVKNELTSLEDVSQFPLKVSFSGKMLTVKDVADVRIESGLRVGAATAHGQEAVLGTVLMLAGGNSRAIAVEAERALSAVDLPDGVQVKVHYSRSFLVNATVFTVTKSLLEGAALVIFILILLVGDFRSSLLVASVIPIAMLGAFIGMKLTGVSANLMSLGAIDFGLIVDGAVVMIENMVRNSGNQKLLSKGRLQFFLESALEVVRPVFFGILIIMIVYAPILFLSGIEGKMFRPMAMTVLFALITSLALTLFLIPALGYIILKVDRPHKSPAIFRYLESQYRRLLDFSLAHTAGVFVATGVLLAVSVWIFLFRIGSDFMPQLNEGDMVIGLVRDPSQGITESVAQQKKAEKILEAFPEVESVFSRMGTPDSATDPMSVNFADTFVILKKDLGRSFSKDELFENMKKQLELQLPKQDISQTQPIEMRFNEILEGSRADVTLRFYGPDLEVLEHLVDQSMAALQGLKGLDEVQLDSLTALTKSKVMEVQPRAQDMAAFQINFNNLKETFSLALAGEEVGVLYEYDRAYPVILHLDESLRENVEEMKRLPIDTSNQKGTVLLSQVADLQMSERVTTIARNSSERYSAVSLFVKNRDIQSFVAEAQQIIAAKIQLPVGYRTYWGGQFKNLEEARSRFAVLIPLTFLLILGVLYKNFSSWVDSALVMSVIPLSMVGGVFSLWLRGMTLTVPAIIGFIALAGIAVLNGVVMLSFIADLRKSGMSVLEAVVEGAHIRLRPVVMTALVAALGFLPMALNTGIGAEVQRPLATVVIGGLVSATFLTLLILPLAYLQVRLWIDSKR